MPTSTHTSPSRGPRATAVLAALLALGVAYIHVKDQGGLPGSKTPGYVQGLYYALEGGGVFTAVLLLVRPRRAVWFLAVLVALGPIVGYVP